MGQSGLFKLIKQNKSVQDIVIKMTIFCLAEGGIALIFGADNMKFKIQKNAKNVEIFKSLWKKQQEWEQIKPKKEFRDKLSLLAKQQFFEQMKTLRNIDSEQIMRNPVQMSCCKDKFWDKQTAEEWFIQKHKTTCYLCQRPSNINMMIQDNAAVKAMNIAIKRLHQQIYIIFHKLKNQQFVEDFQKQIENGFGKTYIQDHLISKIKLKAQWTKIKQIPEDIMSIKPFQNNDELLQEITKFKCYYSNQVMRTPIIMKCCQKLCDKQIAKQWFETQFTNMCLLCKEQSNISNIVEKGRQIQSAKIKIRDLRKKIHLTYKCRKPNQRLILKELIQKHFGKQYCDQINIPVPTI